MSECHTDLPWKWHSRIEDGLQTGSIYAEPIKGHAYSVAVAPKYQSPERWMADASFIVMACENHAILVKALEDIEYVSRKDSLTDHERLDSVRHVVLRILDLLRAKP